MAWESSEKDEFLNQGSKLLLSPLAAMDIRKRLHPVADSHQKPEGTKGDVGIIRAKSSSAAGPFSYLVIATAIAIMIVIASVVPTVFYSSTVDRLRGEFSSSVVVHSVRIGRRWMFRFSGLWSSRVYAVIIDCGSTGSRLLAFTFRRSILSQQLLLEEELWEEVKPGLTHEQKRFCRKAIRCHLCEK